MKAISISTSSFSDHCNPLLVGIYWWPKKFRPHWLQEHKIDDLTPETFVQTLNDGSCDRPFTYTLASTRGFGFKLGLKNFTFQS